MKSLAERFSALSSPNCLVVSIQPGEGKFSHVYKAVDKQGQVAAIKKLKIFEEIKEKDREKCLREVDLMKVGTNYLESGASKHYTFD